MNPKKDQKEGIVRNATITVNKMYRANRVEKEDPPQEEVMEVQVFQTDPAEVSLEYGLTLNLGNYESARVSVGVVLPCYKEEVEDAFQRSREWVTERIQREVGEIRKSHANKLF